MILRAASLNHVFHPKPSKNIMEGFYLHHNMNTLISQPLACLSHVRVRTGRTRTLRVFITSLSPARYHVPDLQEGKPIRSRAVSQRRGFMKVKAITVRCLLYQTNKQKTEVRQPQKGCQALLFALFHARSHVLLVRLPPHMSQS